MRRAPALLLLLLLLLALGLAGCGEDGGSLRDRAERLEQQARERAEKLADEQVDRLKATRDKLLERFEEILADLERAIPEARETSPRVRSDGRTGETEIATFMRDVLGSVDEYWTETLRANDLPAPQVAFVPVPPGMTIDTACGEAGDFAAFYCPRDDTIYVAQVFASALWDGVLQGLPGTGRAAGDFGVAYVLAHEYGHNLQEEFGVFTRPSATAEPFELQADCFAGAWGNSVYRQGLLEPGDVEEAINTALAVGDFDVSNAQHHGTPEQRREAWLLGFEGGRPADCQRYISG